MTLAPGARLAHDEIVAPIGTGGPAFARLFDDAGELRRDFAAAMERRCS